jgi:hypothetical protein
MAAIGLLNDSFGSFRRFQFLGNLENPKSLNPLLQDHLLWNRLKQQLNNGASSPLDELSTEERQKDVKESLSFGNHKGAEENEEMFIKIMQGDVDFGYSLVIPRDKVIAIQDAVISPMNKADQSGINEKGNIILKKRLTHNQRMTYL